MGTERRRPIATTLVAVLILVVLGADLYVLAQRNATTQVDPEEVLAEFRRSAGSGPTDAPTVGRVETTAPAVDEPATTPTSQAARPMGTIEPGVRHLSAPTAPAPPTAVGPSHPPAVSVPVEMHGLPAEGMYTYRTTGGERISVADASHDYPGRTYATVRHLGGCRWEHRSEVIEEHVDERVLCTADGAHLQLLQARTVEFFGKQDSGRVTCDPPQLLHTVGDASGTATTARCRDGDDVDVRLERTTLGRRTATVGGRTVEVVGVRIDGRMTGRVDGRSTDELWLVAATGLTVSWERSVDTLADAAFGARVRYREQATFELESLDPRR